jgi:hypothetical protein
MIRCVSLLGNVEDVPLAVSSVVEEAARPKQMKISSLGGVSVRYAPDLLRPESRAGQTRSGKTAEADG